MCGTLSSPPAYPDEFILENGRNFLLNIQRTLPRNCRKRKEVKKLLALPTVKILNQDQFVLPGNGAKIRFDNGESVFCVLDGTHLIKEHSLPKNTKIVLSSSDLGRSLLGKKKGERGEIKNGHIEGFHIEQIVKPAKAKWVFHLDNVYQ